MQANCILHAFAQHLSAKDYWAVDVHDKTIEECRPALTCQEEGREVHEGMAAHTATSLSVSDPNEDSATHAQGLLAKRGSTPCPMKGNSLKLIICMKHLMAEQHKMDGLLALT